MEFVRKKKREVTVGRISRKGRFYAWDERVRAVDNVYGFGLFYSFNELRGRRRVGEMGWALDLCEIGHR